MKMTRQFLPLFLVLMLASFGLGACNRGGVEAAREDRPPDVSADEQDFMVKAEQANLAEIDASRFALQKTNDEEVRDYASMIQSDHGRALKDLTDLMKDKNVQQPKNLAAADTKQEMDRMNRLTGSEFDREFVNMMVADHQKAVEMFRDASTTAQNADLKKYVDDTLPKLGMHLEKAQRLQSKLFSGTGRKS